METFAMIFAAGLGTRLYPLTANKPKALVDYQGKPLLEHAILKILETNIRHIVINVHHFGEQIIDYINQHHFNATIEISDERDKLLDTAGGLKHAEPYFKNSHQILLYNVDIISNIDLNKLINFHCSKFRQLKLTAMSSQLTPHTAHRTPHTAYLSTLAVRHRQTSRYFLFEEPEIKLCGWQNTNTYEKIVCYEADNYTPLAFSGIHIVDKKILDLIPKNEKISFTPLYLELAKEFHIQGYLHDEDEWEDMGRTAVMQTIC